MRQEQGQVLSVYAGGRQEQGQREMAGTMTDRDRTYMLTIDIKKQKIDN